MGTVSLAALRDFAKVDDQEELPLLEAIGEAAEEYLENAGVLPEHSPPGLYRMAVCGITLHWYDHREAGETDSPDFAPGLDRIINQLKLFNRIRQASAEAAGKL